MRKLHCRGVWTTLRGTISRRRIIVLAVAVIGLLSLAGVMAVYLDSRAEEEQAAEAVFCLSAERRPQLVEAAVNLGLGTRVDGAPERLGVDGRSWDIEEWRGRQPESFDRACTALADAQALAQPGGGGGDSSALLTLLDALLPAAAGAWLTLALTARLDAGGVRRLQAETLRSASLRFRQAAENYLRLRSGLGPGDPPSVDALYERRAELAAQLGQVSALHPDWTVPTELQRRLSSDLGGDLVGRPGPITLEQARTCLATVLEFADEVERVALAHGGGGRRHPDMRTPVATQENAAQKHVAQENDVR